MRDFRFIIYGLVFGALANTDGVEAKLLTLKGLEGSPNSPNCQ
jgi:hypothetical protein